jgi:phage terminase large subunit-like protein
VSYPKDPLLNFAMGNAQIRTNQGLIKIDKDSNRYRIDPVDALLCAFKLALYHDFASQNYGDYVDHFISEYM